MDPNRMDDLARIVGSGHSRRRILKTLLGGALGAAGLGRLGTTAAKNGGFDNTACVNFCNAAFQKGRDRYECQQAGAHGSGPCAACGANIANYCHGSCVNTQTDLANCGACDHVCPNPTSGTGVATCDGACGISCSGSTPNVCGTSCISGCCTNADCDATQACRNGVCLARGGQPCTYGTDCFTQNCLLPSHTCAGVCAGNPCDVDADCTTGVCGSDHTCQQTNAGGACHCSGDCTTGNCVRDSNAYWGTCSQVRAGNPCATNAGCTSGSCVEGTCAQSPACGQCYYQEDCLGYGQNGVFCHSSTTCYPCA